jgi:hypothetical protein
MENKVIKKSNSNWKPNDTQKLFMSVLAKNENALTLAQVSHIVGSEIKSGSITTLITKELVETCDIEVSVKVVETQVYDNCEIVTHKEKKVPKKAYRLTKLGAKLV